MRLDFTCEEPWVKHMTGRLAEGIAQRKGITLCVEAAAFARIIPHAEDNDIIVLYDTLGLPCRRARE